MLVDASQDKGLEQAIYYYGIYEAGTLRVIKKSLRVGDTFIDIGANIGLMSLTASQMVGGSGCVHAFEPVPAMYAILQENISLNKARNITSHKKALGSKQELRTIFERMDVNRGAASLIPPNNVSGDKYDAYVDTFDNFSGVHNIRQVRMLKIDVEGWELEVLRGAKNLLSTNDAPILCIEYTYSHPTFGGEPLDIYKFMKNINNYKIFRLNKGKELISSLQEVKSEDYLPRHDNLFCFLPNHLKEIDRKLFSSKYY